MELNKTQSILAVESGISRSTLSLLERGETVTLATLIQVLRVLDKLQVMEAFVVHDHLSPLKIAELEKKKRKRASAKKIETSNQTDW
jgi:transcriptional regulator with XRE-family HTH domain